MRRLALGDVRYADRNARCVSAGSGVSRSGARCGRRAARFGVHQRLALDQERRGYRHAGDDAQPPSRARWCSPISETWIFPSCARSPPGRQPVETRTVAAVALEEVIERCGRALAAGRRVYWVCPLVEESENVDVAAAEERFAVLKQHFGADGRSGARAHEGRRKGRRHGTLRCRRDAAINRHDRDRSRRRRARGDGDGDRARGALRPRTAASAARPYRPWRRAIHLHAALQGPAGQTAKARLDIMRKTEDGFRIAEEDLGCVARAKCWARGNQGCLDFASCASRRMRNSSVRRATMRGLCWSAIPRWLRRAEKPCAIYCICLSATRRSGSSARGSLITELTSPSLRGARRGSNPEFMRTRLGCFATLA